MNVRFFGIVKGGIVKGVKEIVWVGISFTSKNVSRLKRMKQDQNLSYIQSQDSTKHGDVGKPK